MYLLRHGQSQFNLHFNATGVDPGIEDPHLTELGERQALGAAHQLDGAGLTRLIVSPYTRTLQTAAPIIERHRPRVQVMHEVRERTAYVCDVGSPRDALQERFPQHDFGHLPQRWWHAGTEPQREVRERARQFRELMISSADQATTLVVSHWAFILALTGVSLENGELLPYDPAQGAAGARRR